MQTRRAYLGTIGGAVAALAGCIDGGTAPGTDSPTATPEPGDTAAVTGSWTHVDANAGGTHATGTPPLEAAPSEAWSVDIGGGHRPVRLAGDALFTATEDGVERRAVADGQVSWDRAVAAPVRLTATLDDRLYLTTGQNLPTEHAFTVDASGLTEAWTREGVLGRRADDDLVVVTAGDNRRLAVLAPDGTERWAVTPGEIVEEAERFGPVVLGADHVFPVVEQGPTTAWVSGLDRADGTVRWLAQDPNQNTVLSATDYLTLSAGGEGGATGFSTQGDTLWSVETDAPVVTAAAAGERVFLSTKGGGVRALTERGDDIWSRDTGRIVAVDAGLAYAVGDEVRALDAETGQERWTLDATADLVVPANGGLFTLEGTANRATLRLFV